MTSTRIALPLLLAANLLLATTIIEYELHYLHQENALLENLQALLLGLGTLWFAFTPAKDPIRQILDRALAVLCFSFFLREVDVEQLAIPTALQMLGSGHGRLFVLLALWSLVAISLWRQRHLGYLEKLLRQTRPGALAASFLLLCISLAMDKNLLAMELPGLWEELAETNAYLVLIAGHMSLYASRLTVPG